ncbi:hypothetical protein SVAN01_11081 [Stagonosporopsis vannaccii]|nr:hypothetical protein SVAN01_11081 [Stagonosporopsis vannaccii]
MIHYAMCRLLLQFFQESVLGWTDRRKQ